MKKIGRIKDSCIVIAGQSPKGTSYNENGEGLEFHQGKKAFGESVIEHSNIWTTEITKVAEPGDILMSVRAPVGPTNITDRKICIGRGLAAIRCNTNIIPQYILYALRNIESKIIGNNGAVFNSINKNQIEDLPLPILSLPEQQRIVSYLDAAFAKIDAMKANAENALKEAKALFQASLKEMMQPKAGWEEKKLENITEVKDGTHDSPKYVTEGIPFVTQKNIKINGFDLLNTKKITLEDHDKFHNRSNVEFGDIIIAMIGANRGMSCIVDTKEIFSIKNVGLIKKNDNINMRYLLFYLHSPAANTYILENSNGGAQEFIGLKGLRAFPIPYPPLSEQQTIVAALDAIKSRVDRLQSNFDTISRECDALKQAILREVFEGE